MTVRITSIAAAGDMNRERDVMKASAKGNIGAYALFQAISSDDGQVLSGNIPYAYWFADKEVNRGDFVVLYTKQGTQSEKKNKDGTTSHFFYWGLSSPLWVAGTTPVLLSAPDWQSGNPIE